MEILQLKYFRHAAKTENFSQTAAAFMVPPSSVSVAIKKLETELGVKLFDRTANTLRLNASGRIFLRAVEAANQELKNAQKELQDRMASPSGEIRLLILTNRRIVTGSIAAFKRSYPGVSFNVKHADSGDHNTYREYDVIISDRKIDPLLFEEHRYIDEEVCLAVPRDNPLAKLGDVSLKRLRTEKFVSMPKGASLREFMNHTFREAGISPEIVIECDDPTYIREYVKMGLGVTFFPMVSWRGQTDDSICLLHISGELYRHSRIYLNKDSQLAARLFAQALAADAETI